MGGVCIGWATLSKFLCFLSRPRRQHWTSPRRAWSSQPHSGASAWSSQGSALGVHRFYVFLSFLQTLGQLLPEKLQAVKERLRTGASAKLSVPFHNPNSELWNRCQVAWLSKLCWPELLSRWINYEKVQSGDGWTQFFVVEFLEAIVGADVVCILLRTVWGLAGFWLSMVGRMING